MPPISRLFAAILIAAAGSVLSDRTEAACLIQGASETSSAAPELAGGPDELPACGNSPYIKTVRSSAHVGDPRVISVAPYRSHRHNRSRRDRALARSFGVRYPGFVKVYGSHRYTTPIAVYRGQRYTGFRKVYSGPRYTGSTRVLKANRYTSSSKRYSGQRYSGFKRGYRGPRYTGEFGTTRRARW